MGRRLTKKEKSFLASSSGDMFLADTLVIDVVEYIPSSSKSKHKFGYSLFRPATR
jgi:hypothetical protein